MTPMARISSVDNGTYGSAIAFSTNPDTAGADTLAERMRINDAGRVGIGTTSPAQLLSVNDSIQLDQGGFNNGVFNPSYNSNGTAGNGLIFGNGTSGEGIASKRTAGGNSAGLDFYTGYSNRLAITNGGKVGIGTSDPKGHLGFGTAADGTDDIAWGSGPYSRIYDSGDLHLYTDDNLHFDVSTSLDTMTLKPGRVGIGTTSPGGTLDVQGGTGATSTAGTSISLVAQNGGTGNTNGGNINLTPGAKAGTGTAGNVFLPTDGRGLAWGAGPYSRIYDSGDLHLYTDDTLHFDVSTSTDTMTLIAGKVGIGTTTPNVALDVKGAIQVDHDGTNNGVFNPNYNSNGTAGNGLIFGSGTSGEGIASKRTAGGNNSGLDFYTGYTNRLAITNGGNVGIGITNPSYKLQVNGQTFLEGGSTGSAPTPRLKFNDYSDNSGNPSVSHIDLYGGIYGLGISGSTLNFISDRYFRFYDNDHLDNPTLFLDSQDAKVGIGTTSPNAKFNTLIAGANPTRPSGTWTGLIENTVDTDTGQNGLSVATRWGGSSSKVFEAASYWTGSSESYTPIFTVKGDRNIMLSNLKSCNFLYTDSNGNIGCKSNALNFVNSWHGYATNGSTVDGPLTTQSNSFCYLVKVKAGGLNSDTDNTYCSIYGHADGNWHLQVYTEPGNSNAAECDAICYTYK
jgi:hypothetical protein